MSANKRSFTDASDTGRYLGLLVIGQSNAACHGPTPGAFADPRCAVLVNNRRQPIADPLPGATGNGGSIWPKFAAKLMASGAVDNFTLRLAALAGARMSDLAPPGEFHQLVGTVLTHAVKDDAPATHILIHQGEAETRFGTTGKDYREAFLALEQSIRDAGIAAPIILCRATWRFGVRNPEIHAAQTQLGTENGRIQGPDTDLLGDDLRVDRTHFSEAGQDAFAEKLIATILPLIAWSDSNIPGTNERIRDRRFAGK